MLAPLTLLLPSWVIFFDKATTITRAVGCQRALEDLLMASSAAPSFLVCFETALSEFRRAQDEGKLGVTGLISKLGMLSKPSLLSVLLLHTRYRFWMMNWYTFFGLSFLCCTLSYNFLSDQMFDFRLPLGIQAQIPQRTLWAGSAFFVVLSVALYMGFLLAQLVSGKHSYEANAKAWNLLKQLKKAPNS